MGKQVNFYMHGTDEEEFLSAARKHGDLCVLPDTSPTDTFEPLTDLPPKGEPGWLQVWLWNRSVCKPPLASWVETQHYYTIDRFASEVIEFCRSYEREGRLIRGRIWAEFTWSRMGSPIEKSPEFRKLFNSLANWIKRHYMRMPDGWYAGPEAAEFQRRGGRLVQVDFAPVVKIVRH